MSIKNNELVKIQLFDGEEEGFYTFKYSFTTPAIVIYERDFRKNSFANLQKLMPGNDFSQLMSDGMFKLPIPPFTKFSGSDNLELAYYMSGNYLFIFASGESQPGRYKIYLEGIWAVQQP